MGGEWYFHYVGENSTFDLEAYQSLLKRLRPVFEPEFDARECEVSKRCANSLNLFKVTWFDVEQISSSENNVFACFTFYCTRHNHWTDKELNSGNWKLYWDPTLDKVKKDQHSNIHTHTHARCDDAGYIIDISVKLQKILANRFPNHFQLYLGDGLSGYGPSCNEYWGFTSEFYYDGEFRPKLPNREDSPCGINPMDLLDLCQKLNAEWQYIDVKLLDSKLISIEKECSYPGTIPPLPISSSERSKLTCTIYTVGTEGLNKGKLTTAKNFTDMLSKEQLLLTNCCSFSKLESIYWRLRLRYGCGILPVAAMRMVPQLKQRGFDSWKLPTGHIVPFESVWLVNMQIFAAKLNVIRTIQTINSHVIFEVSEPIEFVDAFCPIFGRGGQHTFIVASWKSGEKYIIDPTSSQFGLSGQRGELIMHGTWEEYVKSFPGEIKIEDWNYYKEMNQILYEIGNRGIFSIDKLINAVIQNLDKPSCGYCGEIERVATVSTLPVRLFNCSRCLKVKYCDRLCQKDGWKYHKSQCIPL